MNFNIITIFPDIFDSYIKEGMIARAIRDEKIKIKTHDLRDWTNDKHRSVDDTPYGGGAGMVMKIEPLSKAIQKIAGRKKDKRKIILLSAKGKKWNQQLAQKYSLLDDVVFVCGRYEGVDERIKNFIDEEVSIGEYVLTGGELGAMVMIDSITRLIPGVLGNKESFVDESHSTKGILEYPQYTKPEIFSSGNKKYKVPKILLSGNHQEIVKWRENKRKKIK